MPKKMSVSISDRAFCDSYQKIECVKNIHKELHLRYYSGPRSCWSRLIINISFMRQLIAAQRFRKMQNNKEYLKTERQM